MDLKQCLEKSGVTLYRVAKDTGISYSIIHGIANGKHRMTRQANVDKIKAYFPEWDPGTLVR